MDDNDVTVTDCFLGIWQNTLCVTAASFILKMFTYVQLSVCADINMKSKKQNKNKNTCLNLA